MDEQSYDQLNVGLNYVSILGFKFIHFSKRDHWVVIYEERFFC